MTTRITHHFRVLFPSPRPDTLVPTISEARYTATKEVDLPTVPVRGMRIEDGPLSLELFGVSPSLSGPAFVCESDYGFSYGWNDMGGLPGYYGLERDLQWLARCEGLGWKLEMNPWLSKLDPWHTYRDIAAYQKAAKAAQLEAAA